MNLAIQYVGWVEVALTNGVFQQTRIVALTKRLLHPALNDFTLLTHNEIRPQISLILGAELNTPSTAESQVPRTFDSFSFCQAHLRWFHLMPSTVTARYWFIEEQLVQSAFAVLEWFYDFS
jgi:hypothetical protein